MPSQADAKNAGVWSVDTMKSSFPKQLVPIYVVLRKMQMKFGILKAMH
jgi:hypothetical protein